MVLKFPNEVEELKKVFKPYAYMDKTGYHLIENAPDEAKKAYIKCKKIIHSV